MAIEHTRLRSAHLERVEVTVSKKAQKPYPPGTALVVRVDDSVPFRSLDDAAELAALASQRLVPLLRRRDFILLALVGGRGLYVAHSL